MRARLRATPTVARHVRASGPARRSSRLVARERESSRVSKPLRRASFPVRRGSRSRWRHAARRRTASCAPCRPVHSRSCRKPRNGATPVPGPTMIIGVSPTMRRPEMRGLLHEHRHADVAGTIGEKGRRHALALAPAIVVANRRDGQMDFARMRLRARCNRIKPRLQALEHADQFRRRKVTGNSCSTSASCWPHNHFFRSALRSSREQIAPSAPFATARGDERQRFGAGTGNFVVLAERIGEAHVARRR